MKTRQILALACFSLSACGQHSTTTSAPASVADKPVLLLSCDSVVKGPDFGTTIVISKGGLEGRTIAKVSESYIGGVRTVAVTAVQAETQRWTKTYTGEGFALSVNLESVASTIAHPAEATFVKNGRSTKVSLSCHAVQ